MLPLDDPAIQFGAGGVFETLRVERGLPHLFTPHFERMERSARFWSIPIPASRELIREAIRREIEVCPDSDSHRLRLTLGVDPPIDPAAPPAGRLFIHAAPLKPEYRPRIQARMPYRVTLFLDYRLSSSDPRASHKTTQYLLHWEALRRARSRGFDEAILLNERGELTEATAFNLFWLKDGILFTPDPSCGGLPGIFAAYVTHLAPFCGLRVEFVRTSSEALLAAEAAVLTNSLGEIIGIREIDGRTIPSATAHSALRNLLEACEDARSERGRDAPPAYSPKTN